MNMLYSLLAINAADFAVYGAIAAVAILAFVIGYVRGFTRTGWGAFAWAVIVSGWLLFETKIRKDGELFNMSGWTASVLLLAIFIAVVFLLFGILAGLLRPKKKNYDTIIQQYYQHKEEKFVGTYEETEKYDDEEQEAEDKKRGGKGFKKPFKVKKQKPRFINRLFGGLISLLNCVIVIAALAAVFLSVAPVYGVEVEDVYSVAILKKCRPFIERHALDLLLSAVIAGMAYGGWRAGFLRGFRGFLQSIGAFVSIVGGFALPFLKVGFVVNMNEFFAEGIGHFVKEGSMIEQFVPVLGQLASGLLLAILLAVVFALLCKLLQVLARNTRRSGPVRFIDGVLGIVAMAVLSVALLAFIFAVLTLLEYFGLNLKLDGLINEKSFFSGDFIHSIKDGLTKLLDNFRSGTLVK